MANSVVLKESNIVDAQKALKDYQNTCEALYTKLEGTIRELTAKGAGFNGDAADGYNEFFSQIAPEFKEKLNELMENLASILASIKESLLENTDPGLGDSNRKAGSRSA